MAKKVLVFEDTPAFYQTFKAALDAREEVEVVTDYTRYADIPQRLKDLFELEKFRTGQWVNLVTGAFVSGAAASVGFNWKPILVIGGGIAGAGVGLLAGGPVGAAVGAAVGAGVGVLAAAMKDTDHKVEVEIDTKGKIKFKIGPSEAGR